MVRVDSVRPFMVLVIFLICLHFNAEPHQTLGFYMEILWLDNCPNKLHFLIFGFQLLKFSNKFR